MFLFTSLLNCLKNLNEGLVPRIELPPELSAKNMGLECMCGGNCGQSLLCPSMAQQTFIYQILVFHPHVHHLPPL